MSSTPTPKLEPFFQSLIEEHPPFLYHYTSADGIKGIIESNSVWASNIRFLNDQSELVYSIGQCTLKLSELSRTLNGREREILEGFRNRLHEASTANIFVCCFSEDPDLLSQWRGYCPTEGGYCIGFEGLRLRQTLTPTFRLLRCVYERTQQDTLVKELIDSVASDLLDYGSANPHVTAIQVSENLWSVLIDHILEVIPIIKSAGFKDEVEWRGISIPIMFGDARLNYRPYRGLLKPYICAEVDVQDTSTQLMIGPHTHSQLAHDGLLAFAARAGVPQNIGRSSIPYRSI